MCHILAPTKKYLITLLLIIYHAQKVSSGFDIEKKTLRERAIYLLKVQTHMMKQRLFHRCFLFDKGLIGNNDETRRKQGGNNDETTMKQALV